MWFARCAMNSFKIVCSAAYTIRWCESLSLFVFSMIREHLAIWFSFHCQSRSGVHLHGRCCGERYEGAYICRMVRMEPMLRSAGSVDDQPFETIENITHVQAYVWERFRQPHESSPFFQEQGWSPQRPRRQSRYYEWRCGRVMRKGWKTTRACLRTRRELLASEFFLSKAFRKLLRREHLAIRINSEHHKESFSLNEY